MSKPQLEEKVTVAEPPADDDSNIRLAVWWNGGRSLIEIPGRTPQDVRDKMLAEWLGLVLANGHVQ